MAEGRSTRRRALLVMLGAAVLGACSLVALSWWGSGAGAADGAIAVLVTLASSVPALAYVVGGVGLGRLALPLVRGTRDAWALQAGLGLSILLTLSHALGWAGAFGAPGARAVAAAPILLGLVLLGHQVIGAARLGARSATSSVAGGVSPGEVGRFEILGRPLLILLAPGVALLLVGACNPPGWLWGSEFGGYDALEYHLQLPQEWMRRGRIEPLDHNVYSFLPGYVEAAYLHLATVMGAARGPEPGTIGFGLTAREGAGAMACQVLHAALALAGAWITGRAARACVRATGADDRAREALAEIAGAGLFLLTPWTLVAGSLAYNEMGMLALFAGALVAAVDGGITPVRRAVACGWLVGVACGVKPTALTFVGVPVGIVLLGSAPWRTWARLILPGALAGLGALAPWLVRNWLACGNPVFPFASSILGSGRWTAEQVTRYVDGHRFHGGVLDRLRRLVLPDPGGPDDGTLGAWHWFDGTIIDRARALGPSDAADLSGERSRGIVHAQWGLFSVILLASCACSLISWARGRGRRVALLLAAGVAMQVVLWMFTTHLQSRFLLPLLVPGSVLLAMVVSGAGREGSGGAARARCVAAGAALAVQGLCSVVVFVTESRGMPNRVLIGGPGVFTGEVFAPHPAEMSAAAFDSLLENVSPSAYANLVGVRRSGTGGAVARMFMLGDSAVLYYPAGSLYHTTWDASPLGAAIRADPSDLSAWTRALRGRGVTHVLYAPGEVARLRRSGWYDPDVTPERIDEWLNREATLVRAWPELGRALFELNDAPSGPGPGGGAR